MKTPGVYVVEQSPSNDNQVKYVVGGIIILGLLGLMIYFIN